MQDRPPLRFAVIGVDHPHIFGQVSTLLAAGGDRVVETHALDEAAVAPFARVRNHDVVERALLRAAASQSDDDHDGTVLQ